MPRSIRLGLGLAARYGVGLALWGKNGSVIQWLRKEGKRQSGLLEETPLCPIVDDEEKEEMSIQYRPRNSLHLPDHQLTPVYINSIPTNSIKGNFFSGNLLPSPSFPMPGMSFRASIASSRVGLAF